MATKFCEIFTLLLSTVHTEKIKVKISQNFVAFSKYMNFIKETSYQTNKNSTLVNNLHRNKHLSLSFQKTTFSSQLQVKAIHHTKK